VSRRVGFFWRLESANLFALTRRLCCATMNKRIKELADQCSDEQLIEYDGGGMYVEVFDKEKFAELIVLDFVKVVNATRPAVGGVPAELALDWVEKNVKAYFGVEE
jgi:hypothetical protein